MNTSHSKATAKKRIENMRSYEIITMAQTQGKITVSWRWRDDGAMQKLHDLVRRGLLTRGYCGKGSDSFLPIPLP